MITVHTLPLPECPITGVYSQSVLDSQSNITIEYRILPYLRITDIFALSLSDDTGDLLINGKVRVTGRKLEVQSVFYRLCQLVTDCACVHYCERQNWYHVWLSDDFENTVRAMDIDFAGIMNYHPETFPQSKG